MILVFWFFFCYAVFKYALNDYFWEGSVSFFCAVECFVLTEFHAVNR